MERTSHSLSQNLETEKSVHVAIEHELHGVQPDAVFILSGGIRKSRVNDSWRSVEWGHPGELGLHTGAKTRVLAGVAIAKEFPDIPIVATSYNRNSSNEPTMASVVTKELIDRGIDEARVIQEEDSFSTLTIYIELLKLAEKYDWKNIAAIGNEYYHDRLQEMFSHLPEIIQDEEVRNLWHKFNEAGSTLTFVDCEPILRAVSPHYATYLEQVYEQDYYAEMVANEAKGVEAIKSGNYVYKLTPNVSRAQDEPARHGA